MAQMTYDKAHAIAWDAANDYMEKHGRARWNEDDYNVACRVIEDLLQSQDEVCGFKLKAVHVFDQDGVEP